MAEELPSDETDEKKLRKQRIIKLILHILLHIIFILYFTWCTYTFIQFDKDGSKCNEPESEATTEAVTKEVDENIVNPETTTGIPATEKPPKEWSAHVLCEINWCLGYGFLVILLSIFYLFWLYFWVFKPYIGQKLYDDDIEPIIDKWIIFSRKTIASIVMLVVCIVVVLAFFAWECRDDFRKLCGLLGPVIFIILGVAISKKRSAIPWRIVTHGLLAQLMFSVICIRLKVGRDIFNCVGEKVARFLNFAGYGARFVYGDRICDEYIFAFAILAVVFFFSVFTSVLYHLGFMQFLLKTFGFALQSCVGTTVCESVNAVGNVFLGMSESPLMIRPYVKLLTRSELHTICTSGFASAAGTVLGAYISFGASATHLITACVMAAPGGLAISKLYWPETEESLTTSENIELEKSTDSSILDAAANGAANALMIVLGIVSNIIAFLSMFYFLNAVTEWIFELAGKDGVTFIYLLTNLFIPLVFVMGVPTYDCRNIAQVVAEKTLINEFVGFKSLGQMVADNKVDQRSAGIATFALCGFANPGSLGIMIAALSAMAPNRRSDIISVAIRAFLAGSVVSFISASFAGILIQDSELQQLNHKYILALSKKDDSFSIHV